jgi:alpha-2-macroglobulin-like protein
VVESTSKTIPILLQKIDVKIYPEGGELVQGLESRCYFEAFTNKGEPADISSEVLDSNGNVVAQFNSNHEGRGRFSFTPQKETDYFLNITKPSGVTYKNPLPKVVNEGVSIISSSDVVESDVIEFKLSSTKKGTFIAKVFRKDKELKSENVKIENDYESKTVKIDVEKSSKFDGVLTLTIFSDLDKPLAERLIFRKPSNPITVKIELDSEKDNNPGKIKLYS